MNLQKMRHQLHRSGVLTEREVNVVAEFQMNGSTVTFYDVLRYVPRGSWLHHPVDRDDSA